MQSTQNRTGKYATDNLDAARNWSVLNQGQVRERLIVVIQIRPQQMTEMALAKDNHVVNAFPPNRPDQPLRISRFATTTVAMSGDLRCPSREHVGRIPRHRIDRGHG